MNVIRTCCIVIAVVTAFAARTAFAEQRYALIIGSNPGWSQDRPLRYAENDAERMRDVLVSLGGFAPDRVELLRDPTHRRSPRVAAPARSVSRAIPAGEDTLVFVYYSGHADDTNLHLRGEPLSHREPARHAARRCRRRSSSPSSMRASPARSPARAAHRSTSSRSMSLAPKFAGARDAERRRAPTSCRRSRARSPARCSRITSCRALRGAADEERRSSGHGLGGLSLRVRRAPAPIPRSPARRSARRSATSCRARASSC